MSQPAKQGKPISAGGFETELAHVNALTTKASKTKALADELAAQRALLAFFGRHPEQFDCNANLSAKIEQQLVDEMSGRCFGVFVNMDLQGRRTGLGYTQASILERLVIDRLIACWLRVQQAELRKSFAEREGITLPWALTWDKRLEIANKNLLRAIRTLALIRRKPVPKVLAQINIGTPPPASLPNPT